MKRDFVLEVFALRFLTISITAVIFCVPLFGEAAPVSAPNKDTGEAASAGIAGAKSGGPGEARRKKALDLLKSGVEKLNRKRYQAALWDLEKGYKLYKHFAFPLFMGRCHFHLDRPKKALSFFKEAQELGKMTPRHKKLLVDYRKDAGERLTFDKVMVVTVPPRGVTVWINGEKKGISPLEEPVILSKGAHKIEAVKDGYQTTERSVDISGGGVMTITIELDKDDSGGQGDERSGDGVGRGETKQQGGEGSINSDRGDGKKDGNENLDAELSELELKKRGKKRGFNVYEWTSLSMAVVGVGVLLPGSVYLAIDGKKSGSDPAEGFTSNRYNTKNIGIGLAVTGGTLLIGAAVVYGVGWLMGKMKNKETASVLKNSIIVTTDPATGASMVGTGLSF